jgi:hypothetical protein
MGGRVESRFRGADDGALVQAMRNGEEAAVSEFIERYQHLVRIQAGRLRVAFDERQHWTADVLCDVSLALMRSTRPPPRSVPAYLITTCRRKTMMAERARRSREVHEASVVSEAGGDRVLVSTCSEESLRQARGPGSEELAIPGVLEKLVSALDEYLDVGERTLLSWMGQRVPYAMMAEWLGISRAAVIKRATRLRIRLLGVAFQFAQTLCSVERRELVRFFRRAGALDAVSLARLETGDAATENRQPLDACVLHDHQVGER